MYKVDPYHPTYQPLITMLMCYRSCGDWGADLFPFFGSVITHIPPPEQHKIEFIIKIDDDDEYAQELQHKIKERYHTLNIRFISFDRWNGRASLYLAYGTMFSKRMWGAKMVGFVTGDCQFTRNFLPDLEKHIHEPYFIFSSELDDETLEYARRYRNVNHWAGGGLTEPFPIVTANIIEICGGFGWQSNTDNWLSLLNVICYHNYGFMLYRKTAQPYIKLTGMKAEYPPVDTSFNQDMYVSISQSPQNDYYFNLVEQQARNIWLNMKQDGVIK